MRAIFFGTPAIAVPSLEALARMAEVSGVVCQPDRPAGRGLKLSAPPVKNRAEELGLEVTQPSKIRTAEFARWIAEKRADVAVVLAYGRILPVEVLRAPRLGCLNLHASLLPRHRGAAPIAWAIERGDRETGVTLMQMDEGLDTGPMLASRAMPIGPDETAGELAERLGILAAELLADELPRFVRGELHAVLQDSARATLAPLLKKDDGAIDWDATAQHVHDHVRAMTPWPGAFTFVRLAESEADTKMLKVLATRRSDLSMPEGTEPGAVVHADARTGVLVACGDGLLEIVRAQLEGRRPLSARELVTGRALKAGARLVPSPARAPLHSSSKPPAR